jgi:hypothetical protein
MKLTVERSHTTVKTFTVTVTVTLFVTFLLLVNIKTVARVYEKIKEAAIHSAISKMTNTGHAFWRDKAEARQEKCHRQTGDRSMPGPQSSYKFPPPTKPSTISKVWYFWFWASYAALLLPTTRIVLALEALSLVKKKDRAKELPARSDDKDRSVNVESSSPSLHENKANARPKRKSETGGAILPIGRELVRGENGELIWRQELPVGNQEGTAESKKGKEKGKEAYRQSHKLELPVRAFRVVIGLLMVPIFLLSHFVLFVVWNICDLFEFLFAGSSPPPAAKAAATAKTDESSVEKEGKLDGKASAHSDFDLVTALSRPLRLKMIFGRRRKSESAIATTTNNHPSSSPAPSLSARTPPSRSRTTRSNRSRTPPRKRSRSRTPSRKRKSSSFEIRRIGVRGAEERESELDVEAQVERGAPSYRGSEES